MRREQSVLGDVELMTLVKDRADVQAFARFYDRHGALAFGLAMRVLGDRELAADATQEGFLALWRARARYDPAQGGGRSWLLQMVRNRAVDLRRVEQRLGSPAGDPWLGDQPAPDCVEEAVLASEARQQARLLLDVVSPPQRRVVELAYFDGLSQVEIADQLDLPLGTVKGRMRLALDKLRASGVASPQPGN